MEEYGAGGYVIYKMPSKVPWAYNVSEFANRKDIAPGLYELVDYIYHNKQKLLVLTETSVSDADISTYRCQVINAYRYDTTHSCYELYVVHGIQNASVAFDGLFVFKDGIIFASAAYE